MTLAPFSQKNLLYDSLNEFLFCCQVAKIRQKNPMYYELACHVENCLHISLKHNKIITNVVGYE